MEPLKHAIAYAREGIAVIPVCSPMHHDSFGARHARACRNAGKQALVPWKRFAAVAPSRELLERWWTTTPHANVAGLTGRISGIIALDQDGRKGRDSLKQFHIPRTPTVESGRGLRYIFAAPFEPLKSRISLLPGVDVQAEGAYGLLPPSVHESGVVYTWVVPLAAGLAPCPEWLLELTRKKYLEPVRNPPYACLLRGVKEGRRNSTAAQLAGHLFAAGLPAPEVLEILTAWNLRNRPPLPNSEIIGICRSIQQRESRTQRTSNFSLYGTPHVEHLGHAAIAAYESLRIIEHNRGYSPGSRLFVSYRELAAVSGYGLGTIPVALRDLYQCGLIEWHRGKPGVQSDIASEIQRVFPPPHW